MNRSKAACSSLKRFDAFGANIDFYYQGREKFNTPWGCFITAIITLAYLIMVCLKFTEYYGEKDGIEQFSQQKQDLDELINLKELGFSFAVENVDPRIGRFVVYQVSWDGRTG